MNIYTQRSGFKIIVFIAATGIGLASLYYTHHLVEKLREREKKTIDLYAKALKTVTTGTNGEGNTAFLFEEIIEANQSVPVILTDEHDIPISFKNIKLPKEISEAEKAEFLKNEVEIMQTQHRPIEIEFAPGLKNRVYYKNSLLLSRLRYYPYVQLTAIAVFILLAYLAFSYSRRAEQNRVWAGMAKETAHQLGTPVSSLMAWGELLKADPEVSKNEKFKYLGEDIKRLEMITSRFSNIGSVPLLKEENIGEVVEAITTYLKNRVSSKVIFKLKTEEVLAKINKPLFEWVIENMYKNAVDAMEGEGTIEIAVFKSDKDEVILDISDTGKGMSKSVSKRVFQPGYTTKKRGWGLGLTLAQRIIKDYHKGKIFVKYSGPQKGAAFRIVLR